MSDDAYRISIQHIGNTANNAFHNHLALQESTLLASLLPILTSQRHAISSAAWETTKFAVPSPQWVTQPAWGEFTEAAGENESFLWFPSHLRAEARGVAGYRSGSTLDFRKLRKFVARVPYLKRMYLRATLARSFRASGAPKFHSDVSLLYGSDFLHFFPVPKDHPWVALEHGTLRWLADGPRRDHSLRQMYGRAIRRARLVWVTNLDDRTLQVAEDLLPGRWAAFPHPYLSISSTGLGIEPDFDWRRNCLSKSRSDFLVFLPSSINWLRHHDKGTKAALAAFRELRLRGVPVSLALTEWGLNVGEAKEWLSEHRLDEFVTWHTPMPRLTLLSRMAASDAVWDQFGLQAFGALALRACDAGVPLISGGIGDCATGLLGFDVPWMKANNKEEIVEQTQMLLHQVSTPNGPALRSAVVERQRTWLNATHSRYVLCDLQERVYPTLLTGEFALRPNMWSQVVSGE